MNVIFNGSHIPKEQLLLDSDNRAFQYGDGIFETMIYKEGKLMFAEDHLERLNHGLKVMRMTPLDLNPKVLSEEVGKLSISNGLSDSRIKLIAWRKTGGLFAPTEMEKNFLITAKENRPQYFTKRRLDFCHSIALTKSIFSSFKRCSSLPYVLAGIEMKEKGLDDIIILDEKGHVAECLSSNIFWIKDGIYYTPSLDTGCIDGIRRKNLIEFLKKQGYQVKVVLTQPEALLKADFLFSTNVAGIYPITSVGNQDYPSFFPPELKI